MSVAVDPVSTIDKKLTQHLAVLRAARARAWHSPSADNLSLLEGCEKELDALLDLRLARRPATIPAEAL